MRRNQNLIIFSAGESVRNGSVDYLKKKLSEKNICCRDWRELFENVNDTSHIALLPVLSKKIPTFDFALVFAESVDSALVRGEKQYSMRDNVLFELGMCIAALGSDRVILMAQDNVHIPDDLAGIGKIGVDCIRFHEDGFDESVDALGLRLAQKTEIFEKRFASGLEDVINHISINSEIISPVFVGASVSSAEAYFNNFIVRLLENIEKGVDDLKSGENISVPVENVGIRIVFPESVDSFTKNNIGQYFKNRNYSEFFIKDAGIRGLFFNGVFDRENNRLTVVDIPTSVTASYEIVNTILNMESDDKFDTEAEKRFIAKEMDIYCYSLQKLLSPAVAEKRLTYVKDPIKKEKIISVLQKVEILTADISG